MKVAPRTRKPHYLSPGYQGNQFLGCQPLCCFIFLYCFFLLNHGLLLITMLLCFLCFIPVMWMGVKVFSQIITLSIQTHQMILHLHMKVWCKFSKLLNLCVLLDFVKTPISVAKESFEIFIQEDISILNYGSSL